MRMDPNGNNRSILYTCENGEDFQDAVASDSENLYIAVRYFENGQFPPSKKLVQIHSETGESSVLLEYGVQDWLFGAFGNELLILYYEDDQFIYRTFSLADGSLTDIYSYKYEGTADDPIARPIGECLYIFHPTEDHTARATQLNILTGAEIDLTDSCPYYGAEGTSIRAVGKDTFYISTADIKTGASAVYLLDGSSGTVFPAALSYQQSDITVPVESVADTGEYYLATTGMKTMPVQLTGNDGVSYSSEIDIPVYSLIQKEDYRNDIPNYISFSDAASAAD